MYRAKRPVNRIVRSRYPTVRCGRMLHFNQNKAQKDNPTMKFARSALRLAAAATLIASLAACSGMSRQQAHAAIGAGAGGALGYVLTGGPIGTIAGAAAGGLIGAG